jgi:hypothetical protein
MEGRKSGIKNTFKYGQKKNVIKIAFVEQKSKQLATKWTENEMRL